MVNHMTNGSKPLNHKYLESLESTSLKKYKLKAAGIMNRKPISTYVFFVFFLYVHIYISMQVSYLSSLTKRQIFSFSHLYANYCHGRYIRH